MNTTMNQAMSQFYIDQETAINIQKFCSEELKTVRLARVIHKVMMNIFSKQTLARLDKTYVAKGFSASIQINQISNIAIREMLDREVVHAFDDALLSNAWKKVYSAGLCPTDTKTSH
ncbi:hypothetical protein [Shewanella algicola]|uniref:hypothetical protein n=1 Tax=Shewanella algicola TaxID=640633 RepID=UPI00249467A7|nr:hypothetical protein [Shewanella algicola]